jgi:hypothetical protein
MPAMAREHNRLGSRLLRVVTFLAAIVLLMVPPCCRVPADESAPPDRADKAKAESLERMLARTKQMVVRMQAASEERRPELVEAPLIHYADQVRNLPESTLWVWQQQGLPVLFCKVEQIRDARASWQYCCVPATADKIDVEWQRQFRWRSRETSFKWVPVADAPEPRDQAPARLTQMKAIVRGFGGETEQTPIKSRQKMRLLASPLHRFAAPEQNVLDGAVFGLTSNGTNPDVLLVVEALGKEESNARWRYAVVGMTGDAVEVVLKDKTVWKKQYTDGPGDHRSWMWYVSAQ